MNRVHIKEKEAVVDVDCDAIDDLLEIPGMKLDVAIAVVERVSAGQIAHISITKKGK